MSANLWAAVRARGCQFLGPAMQVRDEKPNIMNVKCLLSVLITDFNPSLTTLNRWFKFDPTEGSSTTQLKLIKFGPLKGVFAKNERGYRRNAKNKRV